MRGVTPRVTLVALVAVAGTVACAGASKEAAATAGPAPVVGAAEVVAQASGRQFTLAEVDERAQAAGIGPYQALYEARSAALRQMIDEHLLDQEAAARGITRDELLAQEVTAKAPQIRDADIEAFYNQNQARMGGRAVEQMRDPIRKYLEDQRNGEASQRFLEQLRQKASLRVMLEPPRVAVEVAANDPVIGPPDAPVTIVEFSDFQCPFCSRIGPTLDQIREAYGDRVRIVFKDFPLSIHPQAQAAAEAAQCALEQGKFWEYHDKLFANQRALGPDNLKQYAADLALDATAFNACLDSGRHKDGVLQDMADGQRWGVTGTPALFVNGRFFSGAQPFEAFRDVIDEELRR
jgi:protein-disulfide isomerase